MMIRHAVFLHGCGQVLLAISEKGLCFAGICGEDALRRHYPDAEIVRDDKALTPWFVKVSQVLDGVLDARTLTLDLQGTAFQRKVWQALLNIPYGETASYAQIAAIVGAPGAARAVGSACGANRVALVIPCHRVLNTGGGLGGFAYGLDVKERLLAWESLKRANMQRQGVKAA